MIWAINQRLASEGISAVFKTYHDPPVRVLTPVQYLLPEVAGWLVKAVLNNRGSAASDARVAADRQVNSCIAVIRGLGRMPESRIHPRRSMAFIGLLKICLVLITKCAVIPKTADILSEGLGIDIESLNSTGAPTAGRIHVNEYCALAPVKGTKARRP